jgi:hypothetical protein
MNIYDIKKNTIMKKLKYVKLFESFVDSETESEFTIENLKEGAYLVTDLSDIGIDSYRYVGKSAVVNDILSLTKEGSILYINIFLDCEDVDKLLSDFKKYPDSSKRGMNVLAAQKSKGKILATSDGKIQVTCNESTFPSRSYEGLIYAILDKYVYHGEREISQNDAETKIANEIEAKTKEALVSAHQGL